jgi:hypothetical protein
MKVVMAVDGSDESLRAINEVGNLLKGGCDDVVLYTCPPQIGSPDAKSAGRVAHTRQLLAKAIKAMARMWFLTSNSSPRAFRTTLGKSSSD